FSSSRESGHWSRRTRWCARRQGDTSQRRTEVRVPLATMTSPSLATGFWSMRPATPASRWQSGRLGDLLRTRQAWTAGSRGQRRHGVLLLAAAEERPQPARPTPTPCLPGPTLAESVETSSRDEEAPPPAALRALLMAVGAS